MKKVSFIIALFFSGMMYASTNNGFNSEAGHFAGGAALAGGITAIVDSYYPEYREDRGMIGFGVSSIGFAIIEGTYIVQGEGVDGNLLDIACHMAGSALGAYVTDQYILSPVIQSSQSEGKYVGVALNRSF